MVAKESSQVKISTSRGQVVPKGSCVEIEQKGNDGSIEHRLQYRSRRGIVDVAKGSNRSRHA